MLIFRFSIDNWLSGRCVISRVLLLGSLWSGTRFPRVFSVTILADVRMGAGGSTGTKPIVIVRKAVFMSGLGTKGLLFLAL